MTPVAATRALGLPIVTSAGMRALERAAEAAGVPPATLMASAGRAVARWLDGWLQPDRTAPILCLVGPGNNGGDGLVAAAHLARAGHTVEAMLWRRALADDWPLGLARAAGVEVWSADRMPARLSATLAARPCVVDALFGIGHNRAFAGPLAELLQTVRAATERSRIVALDTPSGVDGETGAADPLTLPAGVTLTLGAPKLGLLRFPAANLTGRLVTLEIGLPPGSGDDAPLRLLDDDWVRSLLPERPRGGNKGTFGRAVIVAGCASYPGAAALTTGAAVRAGAGLVTLVSTAEVGARAAARVPEATHLTLPAAPGGGLCDAAGGDWFGAVAGYDALLIGPGLGRAPETAALLHRVLATWAETGRPAVIDADALNLLSERPDWWSDLPAGNVLTPHPGEMARLLGGTRSPHEVDADRFTLAAEAARQWRQIVVLKGAYTVIAPPEGPAAVSPVATPALATAGSGDVLAGLIVGLLAQGLDAWSAALAGTLLHGRAGQRLEAEVGEAGATAGDLLTWLPAARRQLRFGPDGEPVV